MKNFLRYRSQRSRPDCSVVRPIGKFEDVMKSEWQPIETAPKDGTLIQLRQGELAHVHARWSARDREWQVLEYEAPTRPTQWRFPPEVIGDVMQSEWQPIETCPQDGLFIVHEDGAIRMMFRTRGEWQATAVAVDQWGAALDGVKVRETGVYNPTHWMPLPEPPQ